MQTILASTSTDPIAVDVDKLLWKKTVYLDSSIHEVLHMKGEVLDSIRATRKEIVLGRYRIPKRGLSTAIPY
ncbi:uncharacterized protein BDV17DRAFT_272390 [Aspergillus undulatus]|uniref:uncharacterized protein n=1 Tax=Aspergillus undulatus TaxID=1810928 RepID=UPI003CCD7F2F